MTTFGKVSVVAALGVAIVAVVLCKSRDLNLSSPSTNASVASVEQVGSDSSAATESLPRLLDLGAGKCIPCKMMAPILQDLREEYRGKFVVEYIDVSVDTDAGKHYGIGLIPTQIFFDASGKELYRHEGFYGKEDILKKWADLGFEF